MNVYECVPDSWDLMTLEQRRGWYQQQSAFDSRVMFVRYLIQTGRISEYYTTLQLESWSQR